MNVKINIDHNSSGSYVGWNWSVTYRDDKGCGHTYQEGYTLWHWLARVRVNQTLRKIRRLKKLEDKAKEV